eukprot:TRINITY_DN42533_c0_g1_i1.p1 TRINITY_DN42533_c0_g1~~TRINITY_DN42533_c0_g1_i1.p1  ORF type:complete len:457 (+),score=75.51 TRINITY_DN42533_c0_g1_i1:31-1401(+)
MASVDGAELHRRIHPSRWCIKKRDLKQLKQRVRHAVFHGKIVQHPRDLFERSDKLIGPNVYTVNDQYVKPVTALAGNMSWALMTNPAGLDCDVFISHAWAEGVYELINGVLDSWPPRGKHAWICVLANPQNLDISDLIRRPASSPFAHALREAKYVMVVPTSKGSIYTRLWCCYEAHLSSALGKTTLAATKSTWRPQLYAVLRITVLGLAGAASIYAAVPAPKVKIARSVCFGTWGFCCMISALSPEHFFLNHTLGATAAFYVAAASNPEELIFDSQEFPPSWLQAFWCCMAVYFIVAEADRIRIATTRKTIAQLRDGYSGSIQHAECSVATDEANIRSEIGNDIQAVDHSIQVLISAGMSSQALRTAEEAGVNVKNIGIQGISVPFLTLTTTPLLAWLFWYRHSNGNAEALEHYPYVFAVLAVATAVTVYLGFLAQLDTRLGTFQTYFRLVDKVE